MTFVAKLSDEDLVNSYFRARNYAEAYNSTDTAIVELFDLKVELLSRLNPQPSGDVLKLLDDVGGIGCGHGDCCDVEDDDDFKALRTAVARLESERDRLRSLFRRYVNDKHGDADMWQHFKDEYPACPKCNSRKDYSQYDRVYFDSTPDSPSSACTPAEGNCKRCGFEWMETAGEIEETHWTLDEIRQLQTQADTLRGVCDALEDAEKALARWGRKEQYEDKGFLKMIQDNYRILTQARATLDGTTKPTDPLEFDPIEVAKLFHEHYERLAPEHGYKTRWEKSPVDWDELPSENQHLVVATVKAVLEHLGLKALEGDSDVKEIN